MREMSGEIRALTISGVYKWFGGVAAVRNVDLVLEQGERVALIGPNGAGKTTLFNVISGELRPEAGVVHLFGENVTHRLVRERAALGLGRTYQISNLFLGLSVEENLFLAVNGGQWAHLIRPWSKYDSLRHKVIEVAEWVGLDAQLEAPVNILSHGERRQLELGLVLANNPRLIMLDEPSAGLSPKERSLMVGLITKLDPKVTMLLIEHDMDIALGVTNRVIVMHEGSVIAEGDPESIRSNKRVQEIYMGEVAQNG